MRKNARLFTAALTAALAMGSVSTPAMAASVTSEDDVIANAMADESETEPSEANAAETEEGSIEEAAAEEVTEVRAEEAEIAVEEESGTEEEVITEESDAAAENDNDAQAPETEAPEAEAGIAEESAASEELGTEAAAADEAEAAEPADVILQTSAEPEVVFRIAVLDPGVIVGNPGIVPEPFGGLFKFKGGVAEFVDFFEGKFGRFHLIKDPAHLRFGITAGFEQ